MPAVALSNPTCVIFGVRGESIIPTPTLRVSSRPTVMSVLAMPLKLDTVVGALRNQFGYDRLRW
jgi:hypothetical protein